MNKSFIVTLTFIGITLNIWGSGYLAAYMKGTDERHMYYALAEDASFHFRELNGGQPILKASFDDRLIRDPMIFRDNDGIYHMVATVSWSHSYFTIWESSDLIDWTNERLVHIDIPGATKVWAPEIVYDNENKNYTLYWTSDINGDWDNTASIYCFTTKDFKTFTQPEVMFRDGPVLDANIIYHDGKYHLTYRRDGIWKVESSKLRGPYSAPVKVAEDNVEGPFVFPLHSGSFGMVWDYFGKSAGYGLMVSDDLQEWTRITNEGFPLYNENVSFPESIRHGSIILLSDDAISRLKTAFPPK